MLKESKPPILSIMMSVAVLPLVAIMCLIRSRTVGARPGSCRGATWSADGRIVFAAEDPSSGLWRVSAEGGEPSRLTQPNRERGEAGHRWPEFLPGGQAVLFTIVPATGPIENAQVAVLDLRTGTHKEQFPNTGWDLMILRQGQPRQARPLVQTTFDEQNAELSPDWLWLAYEGNNSGQHEIYVRPFPDVDSGLWQVSTGGGVNPLWARNGRALFYQVPAGAMMTVQIERGLVWAAGTPAKLFDGPNFIAPAGLSAHTYDVAPDGQRFLMVKSAPTPPLELFVVQNWSEELKRLVPTK